MLPVLFIGHGSPMNALGGNAYAASLAHLAATLPQPKAILAISAHWETAGTKILDMNPPPTIHDFGGFPRELYQLRYPAPGAPELVSRVETLLGKQVDRASDWGLDHGTWAVLRHVFPNADVPITQLSLNRAYSRSEHFALAEKLKVLRQEGVLILGSGNIVHNLRLINWSDSHAAEPWAVTFDEKVKTALLSHHFEKLTEGFKTEDERLSVPTEEHYLPMIYALGASDPGDSVSFPYAEIQNGSISMRSVRFG
jgi:4,5-DOPA dioxygenase extradiol